MWIPQRSARMERRSWEEGQVAARVVEAVLAAARVAAAGAAVEVAVVWEVGLKGRGPSCVLTGPQGVGGFGLRTVRERARGGRTGGGPNLNLHWCPFFLKNTNTFNHLECLPNPPPPPHHHID